MRLSTIKLAGFKSFVEPTKIPFPDQMTCVVGPNGCGKSNVIDAVRWVLGESSAKNLRGDAMTDVIFNGSTNRKPVSQASVELIFDNTQGQLPNTFADRNQVAIKRLVTRDGQSLYFLNGSKCRKRDITDIFLGTGLGPRSYAIIEQGMISRLIESKPADLRIFLEEAAGVSKYKERRRETQTRIKSTRENLERLLDVRQELQTQVDKLAVQSINAKKYRELKSQERALKGQIAVLKWQKLHQQQVDKNQQIAKLNEQIDFFKQANSGHDDVLASLEVKVEQQQQHLSDAQHAQHNTHTQLTRIEQQQISLKQQHQTLSQNLIKQQSLQLQNQELQLQQQGHTDELAQALQHAIEHTLICDEQVEQIAQEVEQSQQQKQHANEQWQALKEQCQTLENNYNKQCNTQTQQQQSLQYLDTQIADIEQQGKDLADNAIAQQLEQQQALMQSLTKELAAKQSALNTVKQATQSAHERLTTSQAVLQNVTQEVNENKAQIAGLTSMLADQTSESNANLLAQLSVQSGCEQIVEQALLGLTHLTVSSDRANNSVWPSTYKAKTDSVAALIEHGVYPDLLERIAVQDNFDQALFSDEFWLAAIDRDGTIYGRNWQLSNQGDEESSLLLKHKQLKDAKEWATSLQEQRQAKHADVTENEVKHRELLTQGDNLKEAVHQLAQKIASASTRRDMLKEQLTQWRTQQQKLTEKRQQLTAEQQSVTQAIAHQQQLIDSLAQQKQQLAAQLTHAQQHQQACDNEYTQHNAVFEQYKTQAHQAHLAEQKARSESQLSETKLQHALTAYDSASEAVSELSCQIEELVIPLEQSAEQILLLLEQHQQGEEELSKLNEQLADAKAALLDKQTVLKSSQSELTMLQETLQTLALEEQSLLVKAQAALEPLTELEQNLKTVLEQLPESASLSGVQAQLNRVVQEVTGLGAVNLAAIDEYEQAKQRSEYLEQQLDDLTNALSSLEGAIHKIDRETKTRFKATFDQVNQDFGELFPKVFGGGSAYLELTSDDLLESGVSIMARPPGKKNSTIHLLSGGEKALTALSLVFSIFRLNPAPFCMLDEVDAPLDDANVGRFCRLVEEMSQSVQFIYISHNKIAMEMAGRLTGVTMAEPGVSRMVAVDIEQAVQMAHA
ncbi:chromosome segregation protein SMC [Pseudoalteromonas sp. A601]|uniref:chromosome segregation SMC family protein n=1 Tax=Pseudoalteromonas sp. A601 TaxID=1967839 RepID=UPI000B3C5D36|nr:AAA family ATPase [Pseudoalteromonas sp. A601]OUS68597.1 chromosome segregation protein SMC [Pseudoalteromonas sp. A601]